MIAGLDWAIDIREQAVQATGQSSTARGINGRPPNASPKREFTRAGTPAKKQDTTGSQETNNPDSLGPRRPLTIPGLQIAGPPSATLRPSLTGREARTAASEVKRRNIAVWANRGSLQELLQDDIRPSR